VIAGFDAKDELTAFAVGRMPPKPYASYAQNVSSNAPLQGVRIGVVREYMNKELFTKADEQSIEIVERALLDLRKLGATLVDPGPGGQLFQTCVQKYAPSAQNALFIKQFPTLFPAEAGKPKSDHMPALLKLQAGELAFPDGPSIRGLGNERTMGEGRYVLDQYLLERGDANIKSTQDLLQKSVFYSDVREGSGFGDKRQGLQTKYDDKTLDITSRLTTRFALQQIVMQCMAMQNLDAVTYPTGNVPAPKLGAPTEPNANGRSPLAWTLLGANGFPAISVPAGFTTEVYDRVVNADVPRSPKLVGPVPAALPVGIDFLARPFDEPMLFKIAAAYEAATKHRKPPVGFGPLADEP
jgi:amidase